MCSSDLLGFAFEDALAQSVVQVGDLGGFWALADLDFGEAVGGVVFEGAQAVTGEVAVGIYGVGDLAGEGGGDGAAASASTTPSPRITIDAGLGDHWALDWGVRHVGWVMILLWSRRHVIIQPICGCERIQLEFTRNVVTIFNVANYLYRTWAK